MSMQRRTLLGAALALLGAARAQSPADEGRVIPVVVRRFRFTPDVIELKRGETVTLAFTSIDFVHGFSVPDLHLRADLLPGRVTKVRLTPTRAGRLDFLCDNFCGDGHEGMNGHLLVT